MIKKIACRIIHITVVFSALLSAGTYANGQSKPNIVVVLVDALRRDSLGIHGCLQDTSPNIDALARESLRFNNAIASSPWTAPTVASLFTGLLPSVHGVIDHIGEEERDEAKLRRSKMPDQLDTVSEILQRYGYRTIAVVGNTWVDALLGFAQGFDYFIQADSAKVINAKARKYVESALKEEIPFFVHLHYIEPHYPYQPPQQFLAKIDKKPPSNFPFEPNALEDLHNYQGEIRTVDNEIGRLLEYFRRREIYDDMIIIFLSDHGEQFWERNSWGHGQNVFCEEVNVPLFIKAPGLYGANDTFVSVHDIFATLLEIAGIDDLPDTQAFSLLSQLPERRDAGVFVEGTHLYVPDHRAFIRSDGKKIIMHMEREYQISKEGPHTEVVGVYDTQRDPWELRPLTDKRLEIELKKRFFEVLSASKSRRQKIQNETVILPPQRVKELQSLGYLN
jgi:choline-sulfatase